MIYGKPNYLNQVIDGATQPQSNYTPFGLATSSYGSYDAPITQLNKLILQLRAVLSSCSIATLVDLGNVADVAHSSPSWVIDSDANKHISGILYLSSYLLPIKHHIVLFNGSSLPVLWKCVLHPTTSLSLPSSLFVHNSPFNLLYVSQLTNTLQCSITFVPTSYVFQDIKIKKMIGSGHEKDGLYYLHPDNSASHTFSTSVLSATVSPLQWHFCLGHPSLAKLKFVIPILSYVSNLECEACQLGKHHRSSFSSNGPSRQSKSFDLVHTNIWGPSHICTLNGFLYFVIFVDDYSRMTWLFFMKERFELPHILSTFYNEIFF